MAAILITGAGRGIGLALARQFNARGDRVIALCRQTCDELQTISGIRVIRGLDLTDETALADLARQLDHQALDVVIHNAGILEADALRDFDPEAVRRHFEVNALAPLRLTRALLPNLRAGSKIALMTSRMGSVADNASGGMYAYRMSKAALNMVGQSLAVDLRPEGIAVGIFHPGMVATHMTHFQGTAPEEAGDLLIQRIDQLSLASSGQFLHANGEPLPW